MGSWLGYAEVNFYSASEPAALPVRHPDSGPISLLSMCKAATPTCRLNPFLFNGHLQTFWTAVKEADISIFYKRHIFEQEDPSFAGTFAVDFVSKPNEEANDPSLPHRTTYYTQSEYEKMGSYDERPMVVILHGLAGGSDEIYLRSVLKPLIDDEWEACVVNSRGCAMSRITTGLLYNARATWDCRQTVKWLRKTFPNRPLFGLGFSLGANIMATYLGEEGVNCELKAAVVCSNPWNLEAGSLALSRTWLGREIYSKTMGTSMKALFERHVDQVSTNPRIDVERVRNIKYLFEFDREFQGPTWGYPTEGAYYRDASSCDSLLAIRVPLFALHAMDDPIAVGEALPIEEFKQNPLTILCTTSLGGHLSWFESGGGRWFAKPVSNFFMRMAKDIDFDELKNSALVAQNQRDVGGPQPGNFAPMRRKLQMN